MPSYETLRSSRSWTRHLSYSCRYWSRRSCADISEIPRNSRPRKTWTCNPPTTFITTGADDCDGSCPRPIDTQRGLSCHISGIGVAGTWVPNSAVARYGALAGLALRCCSRSASRDAPVAEIANLDELRGDRPDLDCEPQQGGIPRNLLLDETGMGVAVLSGFRLRRPDLGCDGSCDVRI